MTFSGANELAQLSVSGEGGAVDPTRPPVQVAVAAAALERIAGDVAADLRELADAGRLQPGQLLVVGTSTSEVVGRRIGTAGALDVAEQLYDGVMQVCAERGLQPAFQCCEHLNRALVVTAETAERYALEPVSVVPVPKAGGSMAAWAYRHLPGAVVVEHVRAHAGIDIGSTLIGMHLRPVAVPVRPSIRMIGGAHVTMAYTRPKLIGGSRAVYAAADAPAPAGAPIPASADAPASTGAPASPGLSAAPAKAESASSSTVAKPSADWRTSSLEADDCL